MLHSMTGILPRETGLRDGCSWMGFGSAVATRWKVARRGLGIIDSPTRWRHHPRGIQRISVGLNPVVPPIRLTTHREYHTGRRIR